MAFRNGRIPAIIETHHVAVGFRYLPDSWAILGVSVCWLLLSRKGRGGGEGMGRKGKEGERGGGKGGEWECRERRRMGGEGEAWGEGRGGEEWEAMGREGGK